MHPTYLGPKCQVGGIVKRFYSEMYELGIVLNDDVMITFSDPMGTCTGYKDVIGCAYGKQKVELLATHWIESDCALREALVYHELGHAILHLGHKDNTLMDPYVEHTRDCLQIDRKKCLKDAIQRYISGDWYF
jgi:hypothetical protein